jgi:hypothetical protein
MSLESLKARLEQLLASAGDSRVYADGLYQAMLDTKVAVAQLREAIGTTTRELDGERVRLADAERRGTLAAGIGDQETSALAEIWIVKHRERVQLLERKLEVQRDELAMADRQLAEFSQEYRQARAGIRPGAPPPASDDAEGARVDVELDRHARETLVRDQLAALKKQLGRHD